MPVLTCLSGVLITTDVITKQTILHLNNLNNKMLILKDLDDTHLLVDPEWVQFIEDETFAILEKNLWTGELDDKKIAKR